MKKLLLPVCLLVAASASAISSTYQGLLSQETTKAQCENLTTEEKIEMDNYCAEYEAVWAEMQQKLNTLKLEHSDGAAVLQKLLGGDDFFFNLTIMPVAQQAVEEVEDCDSCE